MCCGLGFLGQVFTVKNRGQGRGINGRRFEETGDIHNEPWLVSPAFEAKKSD